MTRDFDKPLDVPPFAHRVPFETKMFGWEGDLTVKQRAQINR
jgi:hypothetical protein